MTVLRPRIVKSGLKQRRAQQDGFLHLNTLERTRSTTLNVKPTARQENETKDCNELAGGERSNTDAPSIGTEVSDFKCRTKVPRRFVVVRRLYG